MDYRSADDGLGLFFQGGRILMERIDDFKRPDFLAILKVFAEEEAAIADLSGGDDERIPPGY